MARATGPDGTCPFGAAVAAEPAQARLQRDLVVNSRGLGGSSDLTLLARVKPDFIESLESVTFRTRVKRVLDLLHAARMDSHEYHAAQLLSDSVERVGAIQSVRVAVFEPEDKVLLSVTFDGPWEAYIRVLWDRVRPLLDLIFCSTEGYPSHAGCSFEEWLNWARAVQRETGFFYGPPAFTARDVLYARRLERTRMRGLQWHDADGKPEAPELAELRTVLPSAEQATERLAEGNPSVDPADIDPGVPRNRLLYERFRTGMQGLAALYRLTDLFVPGTADGDVLHRAARSLLREFVSLYRSEQLRESFREAREGKKDPADPGKLLVPPRFQRELDWLFPLEGAQPQGAAAAPAAGAATAAGNDPARDDPQLRKDVQGGILDPYAQVTHGLVLLVGLDGPAAAARLLREALPEVTAAERADAAGTFCNIAFTPAGLRACGLQEDEVALFPEEFLQGMAGRAGLLGDVRHNHPRRWRLPRALRADGTVGDVPVQLTSVHAVVQLRAAAPGSAANDVDDPAHPLHGEFRKWLGRQGSGLRVLAVQTMKRNFRGDKVVEHFGFADGESEPRWGPAVPPRYRMRVGEAILGYDNAADVVPPADQGRATWNRRMQWLRNGSFLVLRKYRQFPERLEARVQAGVDAMATWTGPARERLVDEVYAKLVGRDRNGEPLAWLNSDDRNDFSFDRDPHGKLCPLHAHIRLANPRPPLGSMARPPRILRRGMSWEQQIPGRDERECGLVFMAYNAAISEQFEVIQRWLTGGNATGSSSGPSCPIVGVPENGVERHFAYERDGKAARVQLEAQTPMFEEPDVFTQLEWGLYLFTPSMSVLAKLLARAQAAADATPRAPAISWDVAEGRKLLESLPKGDIEDGPERQRAIRLWKAALEDADAVDRQRSAALWAAIRADGGVLRTPYGVIVAGRDLIHAVLRDPDRRYSIQGQDARMHESAIGPIFLGMDPGPAYDADAREVNPALMALGAQDAFEIARRATENKLAHIRDQAAEGARRGLSRRYQVSFDAREIVDEVLASLCDAWFFGPSGSAKHFIRGSADWNWHQGGKGIYPGHFIALSRYMFQPHPGPKARALSIDYGAALVDSMKHFVRDVAAQDRSTWAPVTAAVLGSQRAQNDPDYAARTMAGVIMGFTPPITGALLNLLREWARDGRFWDLRATGRPCTRYDEVKDWLLPPMQEANRMRPMPQVIWRTALADHVLHGGGGTTVEVRKDDIVVLGLVSGTQQSLEDGRDDGRLMFGGDRGTSGHPAHACPGYHAGMGAMAGTLAAMLAFGEGLRPGLGALTFDMLGDSGYAPESKTPPTTALERFRDRAAGVLLRSKWAVSSGVDRWRTHEPVARLPASGRKLLFAWGDSWFDYVVKYKQLTLHDYDLVNALTDRGFIVNDGGANRDDYCNWDRWGFLGQMAESVQRPDSPFLNYLSENLRRGARAILLSGGGNDSVRETLDTLLYPKSADPTRVVNMDALAAHVDRLRAQYVTIVEAIHRTYEQAGVAPPPILVHGYDNPIPFIDGYLGPFGNEFQQGWLQDPFVRMGYAVGPDNDQVDVETGRKAMAVIMNGLNEMLATRVAGALPGVHHIDFRGTLQPWWDDESKPGWFDNLHANKPGFQKMAQMIEAKLDALEAPAPSLLQKVRQVGTTMRAKVRLRH